MIELTKAAANPYLGIVTYIILAGMVIERRRRRRWPESEIAAYPKVDLNDPRQRRIAFSLVGVSFLFIFMSAFGSYRAYEYSESVEFCGKTCHTVMKPEFVAFNATSHARIRCVDCHVGSGAESYARSKLNGGRRMDCIDCHNRPGHVYLPPDAAVDQSFAAGRLDPSLPFLKRQAIASLNQPYTTISAPLFLRVFSVSRWRAR